MSSKVNVAALMSDEEILALVASVPGATRTVTLGGKPWEARGLNSREFFNEVAGPYKCWHAFYSLQGQVSLVKQAVDAAEARGEKPDPEMVKVIDQEGYTKAQATDAVDADVALIAACLGKPRSEAMFQVIRASSDEEYFAALTECRALTWSTKPGPFLQEVAELLMGAGLVTLSRTGTRTGSRHERRAAAKRTATSGATSSGGSTSSASSSKGRATAPGKRRRAG